MRIRGLNDAVNVPAFKLLMQINTCVTRNGELSSGVVCDQFKAFTVATCIFFRSLKKNSYDLFAVIFESVKEKDLIIYFLK